MVDLIDEFEKLREHASYCRVIGYKVEPAGISGIVYVDEKGTHFSKDLYRVRVRAGSYAWDKAFEAMKAKMREIEGEP